MDDLLKVATGQIGATCTLISLLIDKGLISRDEVLERFDRAAAEAAASDAGTAGALPIKGVCDFLRSKYTPEAGSRAN